MASVATSPPATVMRKPLSPDASRRLHYGSDDSSKENGSAVERKQLPTIPIPSSARIQDTPLSPVKINFQTEEWARPSTGQIENVPIRQQQFPPRVQSLEQEGHRNESEATVHHVPQRQMSSHAPGPSIAESQHGVLSNVESQTSLSSYSDPTQRESLERGPGQSGQSSDQSSLNSANNIPAVQPLAYHGLQDPDSTPNRHLTPLSHNGRNIQRPHSAYSIGSEYGRGRSPARHGNSPSWSGRAPSVYSGTPDSRPISYIDLNGSLYPQPPPVPTFDNSQLRQVVGSNASLLSTQKTLEMYRANVKKTQDPETQYAFALLLIDAAKQMQGTEGPEPVQRKGSPKIQRDLESPYVETAASNSQDLLREARNILQRLADRSYPYAQYYLADGFASGLFNKGKEDYDRAFPQFIAASKHGHAESGYRAALCYEFGWGCKKDAAKAVQFYRQSASKNHPGAMTRLGRACLSGDLGLNKYREGLKWLKRATDSADMQYNAAPYHLACMYETGYGDDLFQDETYAAQLFTQAADLGHPEAAYRLGDAYEHGKISCPVDPALSVHFYTLAAEKGHPGAMMALCAWYMVGAEPVLEKDENEAYEWAKRAADCGLTKAEYAVGYFTEMGIGCRRDPLEANVWYVKAAEAGDERAKHRLQAIRAAASGAPMPLPNGAGKGKKDKDKKGGDGPESPKKDDKECIVM